MDMDEARSGIPAAPIPGAGRLCLKTMRAANMSLAAAMLLAIAPSLAHQSSAAARTPIPRAFEPQQRPPNQPKTNPAAKKPPPKPAKKTSGKQPRPKTAPGGVVIRSGDSAAPRAPAPPAFAETANAQRDISEALIRAKRDNRRVLIHWGANWSEACQRLHRTMTTDMNLQRLLQYEYELVLVDVGKRERNLDIALSYGVAPQASGVPWLTMLNGDAEQIVNLHAERFADGRGGFDAAKLAEFLRGYQAMYPSAETLVTNVIGEASHDGRPILLQFTSPACDPCVRIEEWFARSDVESILSRSFAMLSLDVERTIGGREVLRRYSKTWQTTIPWFALIDSTSGDVLATSDGLDGRSIAALSDDASIARFGEMLRANAKSLTPQELDWLLQSLRGPGEAAPPTPAPPPAPAALPSAASSAEDLGASEPEPAPPASMPAGQQGR